MDITSFLLGYKSGTASGERLVDVLPAQNVSLTPNAEYGGLPLGELPPDTLYLTVDETYRVIWGSDVFDCTAFAFSVGDLSGIAVGNTAILGMGENTQEPFIIGAGADGGALILTTDSISTQKVRICVVDSGTAEGVDPYYQQLAETMMLRDAKYLGDEKVLRLKGFKTADGNTLGSLAGYSFAGFNKVEGMIFSDVVLAFENALLDCTNLKALDITVSTTMNMVGFMAGSLNGCSALESIIVRDGGAGISAASVVVGHGGNDTFYIYIPAQYYDAIVNGLNPSTMLPASRYRKLEDYPEVDKWNE